MENIELKIKSMISEVTSGKLVIIDNNRSLLEQGLDSLDYSSLLISIEDEFNLEISQEDLDSLRSVSGLISFVGKKIG